MSRYPGEIYFFQGQLNLRRQNADYFNMKQRVTRRAQRYPVHLEVKEVNGQPVADTFLVDLSALGARLESSMPLAPRNQVECSFFLPAADRVTRVAGAVIWLKPVVSSPGRYQMGLQFYSRNWDIDQLGRSGKLQ
jgi:hypothetical protein